MTDKVKQMAPIIWEEIQKASKILLHCHPSTDADSVGSALALMHILKKTRKEVSVFSGDNETPIFLRHLPGANLIIQKNFFEIDPSKFDLFLILDSSSKNQISKKSEVTFPKSMRTVVIDHHTNSGYADINLVDESYPAVCQMIYDLSQIWKLEITPEAAGCLYVGMYTDTGGFKYRPTSSETLLAASHLAKLYPDFSELIFEVENSLSSDQIIYMGLVFGSMEHYFSGKVALGTVSYKEFSKHQIDSNKISKGEVSNIIKSVIGWDIAICSTEVAPNHVEFNFRGRDERKYDLGEIARRLGGGGHRAAAGASVKKPMSIAKKLLLETIKKVYPELGEP